MEDISVFISYAHVDSEVAMQIGNILEELGVEHFLYENSIGVGERIRKRVLKGLKKATHLVVILSSNVSESTWVAFEIGYAYSRRVPILSFSMGSPISRLPYLPNERCMVELEEIRTFFVGEKSSPLRPKGLHNPEKPVTKKILSWNDVDQGINILISCLKARDFKPDLIFGINRGGAIVGGMIAKQLGILVVYILEVYTDTQSGEQVKEYTYNVGNNKEQKSDDRNEQCIVKKNVNILLTDDGMYLGKHMKGARQYLNRAYEDSNICNAVMLKSNLNFSRQEGNCSVVEVDCFAYYAEGRVVKFPWDPVSDSI